MDSDLKKNNSNSELDASPIVASVSETNTGIVSREDEYNPEVLSETVARLEAELSSKDTTIRELIQQYECARRETQQNVKASVRQIIIPLLESLEETISDEGKRTLKLVRSNLEEIASPFVANLNKEILSLTPREIEVCNLIRSGYSSKEIARQLRVSVETVRTQRRSIRRKLGVASKKVNLYTLLNNLEF